MAYPQEQSARGALPSTAVEDGASDVVEDAGDVMGGSELLEGTVTGTAELDAAVGTTAGVEVLRREVVFDGLLVFAARLTYPAELLSK